MRAVVLAALALAGCARGEGAVPGEPVTLAPSGAGTPTVAVAADGGTALVARSADGGRTFAAPVAVHRDGWVFPGCPHAGPSLAVDAAGRLHVAWYTGREGRQGIWHASSADGGRSFAAPRALLAGEWVPPSQVRLAAGGDGVWVAWDDRREAERRVHLARLDGDRTRELAEPVAGASPSLAPGALAWLDGGAVRLRRFGER